MLPIQAIQMKLHFDYNITEKNEQSGSFYNTVYKPPRDLLAKTTANLVLRSLFPPPETKEERKRRIEAEERRAALDKQKAAIKQLNRTPVKNTGRLSRSSSNNNRVIMNPDSPSNRVPPGYTRTSSVVPVKFGNKVPRYNKTYVKQSSSSSVVPPVGRFAKERRYDRKNRFSGRNPLN